MSILDKKLKFKNLFPESYALVKKRLDELDRLASLPKADLESIKKRKSCITRCMDGIQNHEFRGYHTSYFSCPARYGEECECEISLLASDLLLRLIANEDMIKSNAKMINDNRIQIRSLINQLDEGKIIVSEFHKMAPFMYVYHNYHEHTVKALMFVVEKSCKKDEESQEASSSDSKEACP
jgi:hypothetical protein